MDGATAPATDHTGTTKPLRLAVVDHHLMVRLGVASIVDGWPLGRVVLKAEHGLDYERQCAELGHIHIAVVDLGMPVRDGYGTLRWITRHQPRTKALAITMDPHPTVVKRALQAGARGVLSKTCGAAELLRALENVHTAGFHYNELVSRELRRTTAQEAALAPSGAELWERLTPRERELLLAYTHPKVPTLEDAARRLGISPETAETHRKRIAAKLNAHSKAELVRLVLLNGWG